MSKISWPSFSKTIKNTGIIAVLITVAIIIVSGSDSLASIIRTTILRT